MSSLWKKSPRSFGVCRRSSPLLYSIASSHTHTHTHTHTHRGFVERAPLEGRTSHACRCVNMYERLTAAADRQSCGPHSVRTDSCVCPCKDRIVCSCATNRRTPGQCDPFLYRIHTNTFYNYKRRILVFTRLKKISKVHNGSDSEPETVTALQ